MECFREKLSQEQEKTLLYGGFTMLACGALYFMKKAMTKKQEEEPAVPDTFRAVTFPAIVADVDGVALRAKTPVPGTKESLIKLLSNHKDT